MSENLFSAIKADEELQERLNTPIPQHIQSIEIIVFKRYFFELKEQEVAFAQNQFSTASNVSDISNELQEQFYEHQNHSSARDFCQKRVLSLFKCAMRESYRQVSKLAFRSLLSFATTYYASARAAFQLLYISKTKAQN